MADFIINDSNYLQYVDPIVDGHRMGKGYVERNLTENPYGVYASSTPWSDELKIIPRSEWGDRIRQMEREKSRLSDIRNRADNGRPFTLNQGQLPYCWAFSSTAAVMLLRAAANQPYKKLSATAVAAKIYNFQQRGAWSALSSDFIGRDGVPSVEFWPEQSMSRANDNPRTWEDAKNYRVTEGFMDIQVAAYDRKLTFDQIATCLLSRIPVALDYRWWSHAVCGMDLTLDGNGGYGIRILNSWGDRWGENGTSVLVGNRVHPMGAVALRAVTGN